MKIEINLKGNKSQNKIPMIKISINNRDYYNGEILDEKSFVFYFHPTSNNILEIEHYNKTNEDTVLNQLGETVSDLSVELLSIKIDGIKILKTVLYNMPFYVNWPDNLIEDFKNKGEDIPEYITNNLYFGFNGIYKFEFVNDIRKEYFNQFWLDEQQAHINQTIKDKNNEYFYQTGKQTPIDKKFDMTIFDLEKLVNQHK